MDLKESTYVGFRERYFMKICVYNLLQNFSTLKLSWYTVVYSDVH